MYGSLFGREGGVRNAEGGSRDSTLCSRLETQFYIKQNTYQYYHRPRQLHDVLVETLTHRNIIKDIVFAWDIDDAPRIAVAVLSSLGFQCQVPARIDGESSSLYKLACACLH